LEWVSEAHDLPSVLANKVGRRLYIIWELKVRQGTQKQRRYQRRTAGEILSEEAIAESDDLNAMRYRDVLDGRLLNDN
jgi:hypothetical protein